MIDKNFYPYIIERLTTQSYGPFGFSEFMLQYIEQWKEIEYEELLTIVEEIKFSGGIYSFFPFCYLFLEIDLYDYFKKQANEKQWDKEKSFAQINSFRVHPLDTEDKDRLLKEYPKTIEILQLVKTRIILEGALSVRL